MRISRRFGGSVLGRYGIRVMGFEIPAESAMTRMPYPSLFAGEPYDMHVMGPFAGLDQERDSESVGQSLESVDRGRVLSALPSGDRRLLFDSNGFGQSLLGKAGCFTCFADLFV